MTGIDIRPATVDDAEALTRLAHAAKRHWNYPEEWIGLWRAGLTVTPEFITRYPVYCAWWGDEIVGFYALTQAPPDRELEHMWVAPAYIGRGVGAQLLAHAVAILRAEGSRTLKIESDPYAESFYIKHGARRVGSIPSTPAGRTLPVLSLEVPPEREGTR
jgi:GNAT superfamily N-acetyltransferase